LANVVRPSASHPSLHLIGAFDFEQAGSGIDIDALAARYSDPAFLESGLD
jgi:hypothetical protein